MPFQTFGATGCCDKRWLSEVLMVSGLQGPEQTPRGVCEHQGEDSSPPDCQQKRDQGEDPRDSDQQGNTDDSEVPGLSLAHALGSVAEAGVPGWGTALRYRPRASCRGRQG